MEYVDVDDLTSGEMPEEDFRVARGWIRIRGLSRAEVLVMNALKDKGILKDQASWECHMISTAMLAPTMSKAQVAAWHGADIAGGDVHHLVKALERLSGINEGAEKEAVTDFREGSEPGIPVLPSDEAGDDRSPDVPGDEQR
jgi:hypothetical protein